MFLRTMSPLSRKAFIVFLLNLFFLYASGQINESDTLKFQMRATLSGLRQTGNVDLGIFRSRLEIVTKLNADFTIKTQNNGLYQEFRTTKADNDLNSRNYLYYKSDKILYPFAMIFLQTNYRLNIDYRYFSGAGFTFQVLRTNTHLLKFSGSLVYEKTRFSRNLFNTKYYQGNNTINLWRPTLYISGTHRNLAKRVVLNYTTYWQYGIARVQNMRLHAEAGIELNVWRGLSVSGQYLFVFEQVVTEKISQKDGIITFGINYQFIHKNSLK